MEHSNSSVPLVACTLPGQCSPTTNAVDLNANNLTESSLREFPHLLFRATAAVCNQEHFSSSTTICLSHHSLFKENQTQ
jgi:hypothetical protein